MYLSRDAIPQQSVLSQQSRRILSCRKPLPLFLLGSLLDRLSLVIRQMVALLDHVEQLSRGLQEGFPRMELFSDTVRM